jgi:hypothetical protein
MPSRNGLANGCGSRLRSAAARKRDSGLGRWGVPLCLPAAAQSSPIKIDSLLKIRRGAELTLVHDIAQVLKAILVGLDVHQGQAGDLADNPVSRIRGSGFHSSKVSRRA